MTSDGTLRQSSVTLATMKSSAFFSHVQGEKSRSMDEVLSTPSGLLNSTIHDPWTAPTRWNRSEWLVATHGDHRIHMILRDGADMAQPVGMTEMIWHDRNRPIGSITMPSGVRDPVDASDVDIPDPIGCVRRLAAEALDALEPERIVRDDWPEGVRRSFDQLAEAAGVIASLEGLEDDTYHVTVPGPWQGALLIDPWDMPIGRISDEGMRHLHDMARKVPHAIRATIDPTPGDPYEILLAQVCVTVSPPDLLTAMRRWAERIR